SDTMQPDFKRLPLKDYLTPDTILPVKPSFFKDKKAFWEFLSHQQESHDVKGFVLEGHNPGIENWLNNETSDLFFSVSKSMDDIDVLDKSENQHAQYPSCLKMVCWDSLQKETRFKVQSLWDLSKLGVWNHVKIFGETRIELKKDLFSFIASNPNIAHSFENQDGRSSFHQSDKFWIDLKFQPYAKVEQLFGEPFWKILQDPVYLLLYLNKYGKKDLFCMRADTREQSVKSLGSCIRYHFKKPGDLNGSYLDEICRMVEAGGSVDTKYVRYNLERAHLIGYAMENGVIVGNSSLKHPREEFIQRINQITGMDFTHFLERGYTSVRPEYRALGVGAKLLEGLTQRAGDHKIFSIISEDNTATQKIALRNKTRKIAAYYSEKVGKELGVWMPEQMIEDNWDLKK
ncbi:MAG: GNAT family N-acetyltransferase, partial [Pseudomonadota bacterium]